MVNKSPDEAGLGRLGDIEPLPEIDNAAVDSFLSAFNQADRERIKSVFAGFLPGLRLRNLPKTRLALKELFYPSKGLYSFKDHSFPLSIPTGISTVRESINRDLVEQGEVHELRDSVTKVQSFLDDLEDLFQKVVFPRIEWFNQHHHYRSDPAFVNMVGLRKALERDIERLRGEFGLPASRFLITAFRSAIQVRMAASKGTGQMDQKLAPPYHDRYQN